MKSLTVSILLLALVAISVAQTWVCKEVKDHTFEEGSESPCKGKTVAGGKYCVRDEDGDDDSNLEKRCNTASFDSWKDFCPYLNKDEDGFCGAACNLQNKCESDDDCKEVGTKKVCFESCEVCHTGEEDPEAECQKEVDNGRVAPKDETECRKLDDGNTSNAMIVAVPFLAAVASILVSAF